ncbi:MAG: hypothetical protein KatS3mg057_1397 [Herpetosiphonaceae bacterium]|nr:MAG: hypothetical protein KatS3mg057_1397 [Herpetosiphonaceae bacterium]
MELLPMLLICAGILLLLVVIPASIMLLIKLGVIIKKAGEPPHRDMGDYRLDQGREVRSERD